MVNNDSIKLNTINGVPIVKIEDIVAPVFSHFNIDLGSDEIINKACGYLELLLSSNNLEKMRSYLWIDPIFNVQTLRMAVVFGSKNLKLLDLLEATSGKEDSDIVELPTPYGRWIAAQGRLILEIIKRTKEEDAAIQHWLNYEDFIIELSLTQTGCKIISDIYDLRSLDFFLFHYMGGETSAIKDKALFENAKKIPIALRKMARAEEAIQVEKDIENRLKGLVQISKKFGYKDDIENRSEFVLGQLRLKGERFWNNYLSTEVWIHLHNDSRIDLIDAFIAEIFLEKGVLRGWSQIILSLCKVIEREMSISLFEPWIGIIRGSTFTEPADISASKFKKIQSRKITYEMIKKCATDPVHPPTLGQLIFIARFWDDPIMDGCTDLFKNIRESLKIYCPKSIDTIKNIVFLLEEQHSVEGESANVIDLRNASAHPGKEEYFIWSKYLGWLKSSIGQPPKYILRSLIFDLRPPLDRIYKKFDIIEE